jgi:hypothetical protein
MANDGSAKSCKQRGYSQNRFSKEFLVKGESPSVGRGFS